MNLKCIKLSEQLKNDRIRLLIIAFYDPNR